MAYPISIRFALVALVVAALPVLGVQTSATAGGDMDCSDFDTQAQAQRFFENHNPGSDPHRLDADGDGRVCESNPCPCSSGGGGGGGGEAEGGSRPTLRQRAKVIKVVDGDTVRVRLVGGRRKDVRMIGINTPERGRCGYTTATNKLRRVLPAGTRVKLVSDPTQSRTDRYRRLLRYVIKGRKDTNRSQLARGVARVYVYRNDPFKRVGSYRNAQRQAKSANRALWRNCW